MKICPQCRAQFEDNMNFCLQDGMPLAQVENHGEKTLDLPAEQNPPATAAATEAYFGDQTTGAQQHQRTAELNQARTTNGQTEAETVYAMHKAVAPRQSRSSIGILLGALLGGLLLLGTAVGGVFWFLRSQDNVFVAQTNTNPGNQNQTVPATYETNLNVTNISADSNLAAATNTKSDTNVNARTSVTNSANSLKPTPSRTVEEKTPIREIEEIEEIPPPAKTSTPTSKPLPKIVSGGVVNGKATNLVKPPYPAAARAVRASGAVNVQVTIDENGNVISANAVSGHPLLRSSAVQAARASKFSPTVLSGQPVKVTGVIVYNFVP